MICDFMLKKTEESCSAQMQTIIKDIRIIINVVFPSAKDKQIIKKLDEAKSLKNEKNYNYFNLNLKLLTSNDIYNNTLSELINIFKFNKTKIQFLKLKF